MGPMENRVLLLICNERPDLILRDDCPVTFVHRGEQFQDAADRDFNGFYDFLRDNSRTVLGINFSASDLPRFLVDGVRSLPYVEIPYSTTLRVFFGKDRNFSQSLSEDQHFGENRIYRSPVGRVALSFGLAPLGPAEIRSISAIATAD